jgi:hypothetical protein
MNYKKVIHNTPAGGVYSEIYYFDLDWNNVDEENASKCIIRECKSDGTLVQGTFGFWDKDNKLL